MRHYFSPSSAVFFRSDIHGEPGSDDNTLPADVLEVSQQLFEAMLQVREQGGRVVAGANGMPEATASMPPTAEETADKERAWRNQELERIMWLRERHRDEQDMDLPKTLTAVQFSELLAYMQSLRDWPQSELFPDIEQRPQPQAWITDQTY